MGTKSIFLPIVATVIVAVICVGVLFLIRNRDSDKIVVAQKGEIQKAVPSSEPRDTNKKRPRKLNNYRQRQKLIEAIELARRNRIIKERLEEELDTEEERIRLNEFRHSIAEAVNPSMNDIYDCYYDALEDSPDLKGQMWIHLEYEGEPDLGGVVKRAEIKEESDEMLRSNSALSECIINTFHMLELPEPEEGGTVQASLHLVLPPEAEKKN